ncbi:MAG: hypothetical protein ACT4QF_19585 [Sporichthyaceae bacterium]
MTHRIARTRPACAVLAGLVLLAGCGSTSAVADGPSVAPAGQTRNATLDWNSIVAPTVKPADAPRPPASSFVVLAVVHLAVYDAVMAIRGTHRPYAGQIQAPAGANLDAAIAAAAHRAARARVAPSQHAYLDGQYRTYLDAIPDGPAEEDGIGVGTAAADAVLAKRGEDGLNRTVEYVCSASPVPTGEFEPDGGCGTPTVDAQLGRVAPFTFSDPSRFRPAGPIAVASPEWAAEFAEVARFGGAVGTERTAAQTDTAHFWAEHAYVHWNRALVGLAKARGLDAEQSARLFAMALTAAADSAVAGFEAKYHFRVARPRTAIPGAADDANPTTSADAAWKPLLSVNHPEYPSAHGFVSAALTDAVAAFLGTREFGWALETSRDAVPALVEPRREFAHLDALLADISNARIWGGLHYRHSMRDGIELGRRVAAHVLESQFGPR